MKKQKIVIPSLLLAAALASGCATPVYYPQQQTASYPQAYPDPYPQTYPVQTPGYPASQQGRMVGTVQSIQMVQGAGAPAASSGMGAIVGGVVGGLLGNQVGGGSGRKAATIAGVVGGAVVGNQMERNSQGQARESYQVGIAFDHGGYQTLLQDDVSGLRIGDRVRIENNRAYRYAGY